MSGAPAVGESKKLRVGAVPRAGTAFFVRGGGLRRLPNFLEQGGMMQFVVREDRIRFAVNVPVAAKAGLTVNSKLLKVAAEIKKDSPEEAKP